MLFDVGPDVFESEKERNLYYKIFAGYLFNEHVPGVERRVRRFCNLLDETPHRGRAADGEPVILDPATSHVSFDNHAYRFESGQSDRGEFAESEGNSFRVLLWEDLRDVCGSDRVGRFLTEALADRRGASAYRFEGGWFNRLEHQL